MRSAHALGAALMGAVLLATTGTSRPRLLMPLPHALSKSKLRTSTAAHESASTAECDCGYSVNASSDPAFAVFTSYLETDFLHLDKISDATEWQPQVYNVSTSDSRGPYGKLATLDNVVTNPIGEHHSWTGPARGDGDAGLQLIVRAQEVDGMIPLGEIVTFRRDMLYGSYRVAMKLTSVPGTCGAFFWVQS